MTPAVVVKFGAILRRSAPFHAAPAERVLALPHSTPPQLYTSILSATRCLQTGHRSSSRLAPHAAHTQRWRHGSSSIVFACSMHTTHLRACACSSTADACARRSTDSASSSRCSTPAKDSTPQRSRRVAGSSEMRPATRASASRVDCAVTAVGAVAEPVLVPASLSGDVAVAATLDVAPSRCDWAAALAGVGDARGASAAPALLALPPAPVAPLIATHPVAETVACTP
eukprot:CAMPEP_0196792058 /NCGR_PEP_ID=MMETSP1104-20130614/30808_1 /TAXON_ID=33652 /ORGANISM="Cafeteria sp., Strain Caron Lab Isolate" /LENGTH=227 /DNA_ID=CAMNT_0042162419 /DNA_START=84 /DNA_END=765 /DNA_ORIENTATION=+